MHDRYRNTNRSINGRKSPKRLLREEELFLRVNFSDNGSPLDRINFQKIMLHPGTLSVPEDTCYSIELIPRTSRYIMHGNYERVEGGG